MERLWLMLGGTSGLFMVAAGAFGAHALKTRLDEKMLQTWETATRYGLAHAVALIALAALAPRLGTAGTVSGWAFVTGTLLFSGSLMALALSGQKALGAITPLGGLAFMIGWGALVWGGYRLGTKG